MLHPPSIINLSLSAFAFLLSLSLSLPGLQLSSAHSNKSLHPPLTPVPPQKKSMQHTQTYMCTDALMHTNTQRSRQQPQRPHINKSAPLLVLSVSGRERGRRGGGRRRSRTGDAEITRGEEEVTDCSRIIRTRRAEGDRQRRKVRHQQALEHAISIDNRTPALR